MKVRDPKRIPRILTLLFKIWEQQPDLRFNQLVQNLQSLYSQKIITLVKDIFLKRMERLLVRIIIWIYFTWRMTSGSNF